MKLTTKFNPALGLYVGRNGFGFYHRCDCEAAGLAWLRAFESAAHERIDAIERSMSGMDEYVQKFGTAAE